MEDREQPSHCHLVAEWGDQMQEKRESDIRIMFQNINGLPISINPKDHSIMSEIQNREIDYLGMVEMNINWHQLAPSLSLRSRTKGWFSMMKTSYSNNIKIPWNQPYQRGGVSTIAVGKLVSHVLESTTDNRGMGRWCITRFRGSRNYVTTVITAYRPVPSNEPGSTFIQHQTVLGALGIVTDPREQFFHDLRVVISEYLEKGDQIMVMLDANGDIRSGLVHEFFQSLNLSEIISSNHGNSGPSTMMRNQRQVAIDGIFVSPNLLFRTNCGYLDFGDGIIGSDHRAIWVDFPMDSFLGGPSTIPVPIKARRLQMNQPETVNKYLEELSRYLYVLDFDHQVNELLLTSDVDLCKLKFDEISRLQLEACRLAEQKCRKLKMGAIPYSPVLSRSIILITLWKRVLRRLAGYKSSLRYIRRLAKRVDVVISKDISSEQAREYLRNAQHEYYTTIKPTGSARRESFLSNKISVSDSNGDVHLAIHYRNLMTMEKTREINRRLNYITKSQSNRIQFIIGRNNQGTVIQAESKEDMEQVMGIENRSRFTQSQGTPFMSEPLSSIFGPLGLSLAADQVTEGTYQPDEELSLEIKELLLQCKEIKIYDQYDFTEALISSRLDKGWAKMKERISTSPYGLHVGHLKALYSSSSLAESHRRMSLLPVLYGFIPDSFCKATNVFIEKKPGLREVSSLRTIVLYDAIFNMNNKLIAKIVMERAEQLKALAIEQYGSRKSKSAMLQTLNKRVIFDSIRQSRRPTIVIGNDMKSAYDRIVHSFAALALRRIGLPKDMIYSLFGPLQLMQHHTRTIFGDSHTAFQAGDTVFHGVGQGNGAGPMIWTIVSSVIFAAFRKMYGGGLNLPAFKSYEIPVISGLAFVDDVDIFVMANENQSLIQVIDEAQKRLTSYERLIKATGGAINPSKSYVYYLVPDHDRNSLVDGTSLASREVPMIHCKDYSEVDANLPFISANQSQKTLGVHLAPSSNQDDQITKLISFSEKWADHIRINRFSKTEILYALESRFFKQVEYPLLSISLTRSECNRIMSPLLKVALPKMGLLRTLPRVLLYGPSRYQGLQFRNIFTESLSLQLSALLVQMHSNQITQNLLSWSMRCTLHEVGFSGPIHTVPLQIITKLATPTWYTHLITSLLEYSITVEDNIINHPLKRERDFYLLEYCYNRGFPTRDLIHINLCRLYLGINMASDFISGCGNFIQDWVWEGDQSGGSCRPMIKYHRPLENSWRVWRRMLRQIFGYKGKRLPTANQLGHWTTKVNSEDWYCFVNQSYTLAYVKSYNSEWSVYRVNRKFSQGFKVRLKHSIRRITDQDLPDTIYPASIHTFGNHLWLSAFILRDNTVNPIPSSRPFQDKLLEFQSKAKSPIAEMIVGDQANQIAIDITNGTSWGVCDGSYSNDIATSAFCINATTEDQRSRLVSVTVVPGEANTLSAFRAELWGIYNFVLAVKIIVEAYSLTEGQIVVWCDNMSAVSLCSNRSAVPSSDHYDILSAIYFLLNDLPHIKISFRHVRGHQDRHSINLSREEMSNIDMDHLAQDCRIYLQSLSFTAFAFPIPITRYSVRFGEDYLQGNIREWLYDHIHGKEIKDYWTNKGRINPQSIHCVDWNLIQDISLSYPLQRRWTISKLISGFAGVGKWLHRFDPRLSSACPFCLQPDETTDHVVLCQSDQVKNQWLQKVDDLNRWINDNSQLESFAIIAQILKWWQDPSIHAFPVIPVDISEVIQAQSAIGWKLFFQGILSTKWGEYVDSTFVSPSRYAGRRFLKALVKKLYDLAFDMWSFRNEQKHDPMGAHQVSIRETNEAEIRHQFMLGNPNQSDIIRRLLRKGMLRILRTPIRNQNIWLASIISAREQQLNQEEIHQRGLSNMQKIFRNWLKSNRQIRNA